MAQVKWTPEALRDRSAIFDYIAADNPPAAKRMDQLFSNCAARLADFPKLGHEGEVLGTRELTPHKSYRLVYEIAGDTVWILVLIHSARQWPPVETR